MADFRPETTVYLFRNTCVDDENQPYFESESAKLAWYNAHSPKSYEEYSYQRENRNYIRVQDKAENLRMYDMMCFHNSAVGRYVFCRIMEVEFINPNTTEITYEVDYMATYVDVIRFGPCWVEREMQDDDWDGSKPSWNNLQPEGIEPGPLRRVRVPGDQNALQLAAAPSAGGALDIIVLSAYNKEGEPIVSVRELAGIPTGLNVIKFGWPNNRVGLGNMIETYSLKGILDGIAAIFVGPVDWMDSVGGEEKVATMTPTWNMIEGYQLVNAKCFTSEFCNFELSNGIGNSVQLRPENFTETDTIYIDVKGGFSAGGGGAIAYPRSYETNPMEHGVVIPFDLQCAYVGNAFANWLAQNKASFATDILSSIGKGMVTTAITGTPVYGATSAITSIMGSIAKVADRMVDPLAIGGQSAGNGINYTIGNVRFTASLLCPYVANLRSIDDFFSRFGYRTNRFKVPNVNTRPKWNYVKTSGAVCTGPFPKKAQIAMEKLMNNGVTFWHLSGGENIYDDWKNEQNKQ